jgi:hypothetical protein
MEVVAPDDQAVLHRQLLPRLNRAKRPFEASEE